MTGSNSDSVDLRKTIVEQLDACVAAVESATESSTERVHEARKAIKRARALLALRRTQRPLQRDADALRLVAHSLGRVRDSAALVQSWFDGADRISEPARRVIAEILAQHQSCIAPPERESRRLRRAGRVLGAVRGRVATTLENGPKEGAKQLERRARRSYRRARRAMRALRTRRRAGSEPGMNALHRLRRAAKQHQYQLQFLEPLWPRPLKAQRKELGRLTELLGTHRDLTAIERLLQRMAPVSLQSLGDEWREQLQRWRADLLGDALELARVAFSESPRGFEKRLHGLFTSSAAPPGA